MTSARRLAGLFRLPRPLAPAPGPLYDCATCHDTEFVRSRGYADRASIHYGISLLCPACHTPGETDAWCHAVLAPSVPAALWGSAAIDAVQQPAQRHLLAWLETPSHPWLVLTGPPGTGKTSAAAAAARRLAAAGLPIRWTTAPRLLDHIRASFDAPGATADIEAAYRLAPVLVLDDLGAEHSTPWARERLTSILDDRWTGRRLTILTTNLHPRDAPADRLWSRVYGDRHSRILPLSGPDRRRKPRP